METEKIYYYWGFCCSVCYYWVRRNGIIWI